MERSIFIAQDSPALIEAAVELNRSGVSFCGSCEEADVLLYSVPTAPFLRDDIPIGPCIIGGNLDFLNDAHPKLDLLKDPYYLAQNARITAEAALGLILPKIESDFAHADILILGWGRIGKCLDQIFRHLGFPVSVYARNPKDRAMLSALGYTAVSKEDLLQNLSKYHCMINTAPAQILTEAEFSGVSRSCVKVDLASVAGLPGPDVIHARGLPGKYKPKASGKLIAQTILRHWEEVCGV